MTLTVPVSLTRRHAVPILIGLTALSLAACGSSPTATNSSTQAAGVDERDGAGAPRVPHRRKAAARTRGGGA